jgi:1-acyl-sn-glycerol-3-phosphate acyltransferase
LENFPRHGAAIVVVNHLGDADAALALAFFPRECDLLGKAELHDFPLLGWIMDAYGVVWVHRGQPDRRALRSVLEGLKSGRIFAIAPEGRESLTGGLEEGTHGAAYLVFKAGVPVLPVTVTGTANREIYPALKRLRRPPVSLTIGPAFHMEKLPEWRQSIEAGTHKIMTTLAGQLPPEYQGIYAGKNPGGPV